MAEYQTVRSTATGAVGARIDEGLRAHMNKVYGTMSVGMLITALAAWAIAGLATTGDPALAARTAEGQLMMLRDGQYLTGLGQVLYATPLRWVLMFAPLAFILFGWGALMSRASAAGVQLGFFIFATAIGVSLSSIFLVFTAYSITQVFLITAIAFAGLSLFGYVTKRDLSPMGGFLIMGMIGVIAAAIMAMFIEVSAGFMFALSAIGVLVFSALTAFFTQGIKNTYIAHAMQSDQEWLDKAAIDGALSLYISFLNMFQFLLMFMGQQE